MVVMTRAGHLREWLQGEQQLYFFFRVGGVGGQIFDALIKLFIHSVPSFKVAEHSFPVYRCY